MDGRLVRVDQVSPNRGGPMQIFVTAEKTGEVLYGPRNVAIITPERAISGMGNKDFGGHQYAAREYVHCIETADDEWIARNDLTLLGQQMFRGKVVVELTENQDYANANGVFQSVTMTPAAFASYGLKAGDSLLALYRRESVPGYGLLAALVRPTPEVLDAFYNHWPEVTTNVDSMENPEESGSPSP